MARFTGSPATTAMPGPSSWPPTRMPDPPTVPVATLEPTSETANNNFGYVPGSVMISADGERGPRRRRCLDHGPQQRRTPCLQHLVAQHRIVEQRPGQHRDGQVRGADRGQRRRSSSARRTACRSSGSPERVRRPRRPTLRPTSAPRRYRVRPSNWTGPTARYRRTSPPTTPSRNPRMESISRRWPMPARSRRATPSPA